LRLMLDKKGQVGLWNSLGANQAHAQ